MKHLNEVWEHHRAFLVAIYEYQVFLKEEKMVDGTSSAHEVQWKGIFERRRELKGEREGEDVEEAVGG